MSQKQRSYTECDTCGKEMLKDTEPGERTYISMSVTGAIDCAPDAVLRAVTFSTGGMKTTSSIKANDTEEQDFCSVMCFLEALGLKHEAALVGKGPLE
ncbi:MAG: hypothetical protein KGI71_05685 [Patescibacteria group bacterium]|nr:hypothetical protein [Patescibacteria group bacterium]